MSELTLSESERLLAFEEAERTFPMDEEAFRGFYELTSRAVWVYLARTTGDKRLADDLLQETYYRFLCSRVAFESDDHRRHYLFRIASNLVRDEWRAHRPSGELPADVRASGPAPDDQAAQRIDLTRAFEQMRPRDRSLLWLAYAQGWSHEEIAKSLGLKRASLKAMLHRARGRLMALLVGPRKRGRS
jgi:RNA polymerase sigma-70 factor (ECF subfamily)